VMCLGLWPTFNFQHG